MIENRDLQDDRIVSVISRECDIMTETIDSMPVEGGPEEQAEIISDQNRAIANMLKAIREVDSEIRSTDKPTDDWLDDWDKLIDAREAFAEQVSDGYETDLDIPRDSEGEHIYHRMDEVFFDFPAPCEVPADLLNPYPAEVSAA